MEPSEEGEAVFLSISGGIAGIIMGVVFSEAITIIAGWPALISLPAIAGGFFFSAAVEISSATIRPARLPASIRSRRYATNDGAHGTGNAQAKIMIAYTVAAVIGVMIIQYFWASYTQIETVPYSQFEQLLNEDKIAEVTVAAEFIQGTLKAPLPDGKQTFFAVRVDPDIAAKLAAHGVTVKGVASGGIVETVLSWIIPAAIFYLIWMMLFRRMADRQGLGGLMAIGKSRAKVYVETNTKVTFKDVAGVEEAKSSCKRWSRSCGIPRPMDGWGRAFPRASSWSGRPAPARPCWPAPWRARRMCRSSRSRAPNSSRCSSASVPPASATCSSRRANRRPASSSSMSSTRSARARHVAPGGGGVDEKEQTLNQLLAELDGFDPSAGVILLAATNRPEILDPASAARGRFDRQVLVDRPDKGRLEILRCMCAR